MVYFITDSLSVHYFLNFEGGDMKIFNVYRRKCKYYNYIPKGNTVNCDLHYCKKTGGACFESGCPRRNKKKWWYR